MFNFITSVYAPHICLGCQAEGAILCANCETALPQIAARCYRCHTLSEVGRTCSTCRARTKLTRVQVVTEYEGFAKELIKQLKFAGNRSVAGVLAQRMSSMIVPSDTKLLIVPTPTATSRVRLRGYDQSVLIARRLAGLLDMQYYPALLRQGQQRQLGARRQDRLRQMQQSFVVSKDVSGQRVLLIDDVITTGSTLEAAALALKHAGARSVEALVYARA